MEDVYKAPEAKLDGFRGRHQSEAINAVGLEHLRRTGGWARLLGILSIVGGVIMIILGLFFVFMDGTRGWVEIGGPSNGWLYVIMGILYIYPGAKSVHYASAIKRLLFSGSEVDLNQALDSQRVVWRFIGFITIMIFVLFVVRVLLVGRA